MAKKLIALLDGQNLTPEALLEFSAKITGKPVSAEDVEYARKLLSRKLEVIRPKKGDFDA